MRARTWLGLSLAVVTLAAAGDCLARPAARHSASHAAPAQPAPPKVNGQDEGKAGMEALDRGAYAEAEHRFTAALNSGDLSSDEQELAYLNRAKSFGGDGDYGHAILDLKHAIALKPDDTEAQDDLQIAVSKTIQVAGIQPGQPHPDSALQVIGKGLLAGALANIAQGVQDANDQQ